MKNGSNKLSPYNVFGYSRGCRKLSWHAATAGAAIVASLSVVLAVGAAEVKSKISKEMLSADVHGLAHKLRPRVAHAYPFDPAGMMWLNGEPERLRCSFDNDVLYKEVLYGERQIIVYPLAEYRALYKKSDQLKEFDKRVRLMRTALKHRKTDREEIAVFPSIDACQLFRAQVRFINFKGGRGVRFITRYATDVSPTTANNIFYTFQGMTDDEKYWVSVFYPIRAPGLKETTNDKLSKALIERLKTSQFHPALDRLDRMVGSIAL